MLFYDQMLGYPNANNALAYVITRVSVLPLYLNLRKEAQ
jgi:hypothetical protein